MPHINKLNHNRHRVDSTAAGDTQDIYSHGMFTYSHSLDKVKESIGSELIGRILDCHA